MSEEILNRKYKDTVFRLIFNNEEKMLELYNALYDTNYPPGTPVNINTIEEALYLSDKNDIYPSGDFRAPVHHQSQHAAAGFVVYRGTL